MPFGFEHDGSTLTNDVEELLQQLEEAALNGNPGQARREIERIRRRLDRYTQEELARTYRGAYKDGSELKLTRQASASSLTIRKRVARNGTTALNDLDKWVRDVELSAKDRENLRKVQKIRSQQVRIRDLPSATRAQQRKAVQTIQLADEKSEELRKSLAQYGDPELRGPTVQYRRRRKGGGGTRGTVFQRQSADQYFRMLERTSERDAINDAYIKGRVAEGVEWFLVSDGAECGWSSHRDPEKANGKIVHHERIISYAHPNCVRRFEGLPDGPRSKKTLKRIEELTGLVRDRQALSKIAAGAAIAGQAYSLGQAVVTSPLARSSVRAILADTEIALSENTKKILQRWGNVYERNELTALSATGAEVSTARLERLRQQTVQGLEQRLSRPDVLDGSDLTKVTITQTQARVLGFKSTKVSRGELLSRTEDYSDFLRHTRDTAAPPLRAVSASIQDEAVIRRLHLNEPIMLRASRMGRGSSVWSNTKRTLSAIDKARSGRPELAEIELVRLFATAVEPLPWLSASAKYGVGRIRFSVGMTAEGRRDLASTLYLKMRGQDFRGRFNVVYSRNALGQPIKNPLITPQDLYEAMIPRITFIGKPVNFSIAAESGRLIPAVHIYPENTYLRQLSLTWRLRSGVLDDLIKEAAELDARDLPKFLRERLPTLPEDMITTIDAFRNGPITASARFTGSNVQGLGISGLESYAVKFRPDSRVVNMTYRVFRRPGEATRPLRKVVLMPRAFGGIPLRSNELDVLQAIAGLAMTKGSFMEAARALGLSYTSVLYKFRGILRVNGQRLDYLLGVIRDYSDRADDYALSRLISFEELQTIGKQALPDDTRFPFLGLDPDNEFVEFNRRAREQISDPVGSPGYSVWGLIEAGLSQHRDSFEDVFHTLRYFESQPELRNLVAGGSPRVRMLPNHPNEDRAFMWYSHDERTIYIAEGVADNHSVHRQVRQRMEDIGYIPYGTTDPIYTVVHEYGHHVAQTVLSTSQRMRLWNKWITDIDWGDPTLKDYFLFNKEARELADLQELGGVDADSMMWDLIHERAWLNPGVPETINLFLSSYASSNYHELLAEAFLEMVAAPNPGPFGAVMREFMIEEGLIVL